jgi:pyridoxal phosphate enzyme (YggS family)
MKSIILQNLHDVQYRIQNAEQQYGRVAGAVKLLAVSKTQSAEKIRLAYEAGQQLFGENYLQEALAKQMKLTDLAIEWHFIGHIQSNKTKLLAEHFSWVHTVSRAETAIRLSKQRPHHLPPLNVCIQVNISGEQSKDGILPDQLTELARQIINLPNLSWRGLMTIPAPTADKTEQHRQFAELRLLFESLKVNYPTLDTLSMGMSADLEAAIAEGATIVRIGTAIFGERE